MRIFAYGCILLCMLAFSVVSAEAETRYVSDQISVTLRRGPGTEYKILKSLSTGAALEVLEEADTYLKVRTGDGVEGYVLKQYISAQLPKSQIINRQERELSQLKERLADMNKRAQEWTGEKEELQRQIADVQNAFNNEKSKRNQLETQHQDLLEGTKNVVELLEERDRLKAENETYEAEMTRLRKENDDLLRKAIVKWFLAGAGVLFGGWLLGKSSRTKKRSF